MPFRTLDPQKILVTAQELHRRVAGRFPDRGLSRVATELVAEAQATIAETQALRPPIWWLRALVGAVVLAGAGVFLMVGSVIPLNQIGQRSMGSFEGIEAALNIAVLGGLALVALSGLEARVKRRRVARGLHGLRAIIHVIDMHQLTKDPLALTGGYVSHATSPPRDMTAAELERYLDYCSEMLAITGKLAALYAQAVPDDGVAQAVNDIETLGSSLGRKIWQKITLIGPLAAPGRTSRRGPAD